MNYETVPVTLIAEITANLLEKALQPTIWW